MMNLNDTNLGGGGSDDDLNVTTGAVDEVILVCRQSRQDLHRHRHLCCLRARLVRDEFKSSFSPNLILVGGERSCVLRWPASKLTALRFQQ